MTEPMGVRLQKNTGSQEFNLKCETVEVNIGNNLIARAILSTLGQAIAAADPVIATETYQLTGVMIQDVDSSDYPSGLTDVSGSEEKKMERALRTATKEWGPDARGEGLNADKLIWNGEEIDVVITSYSAQESSEDPKPGVYRVSMELTHIDFYAETESNLDG